MRIRKHAKISPLIYAAESGKVLLSRVCQLNQSPWDVIAYPIEENDDPQTPFLSQPLCSSNYYQVDGYADDNGTFYDSNGTVESVTSMKVDEMKATINWSKWDNYFERSAAVDISVNVKKMKQDKGDDVKMAELGLSMDENNNADNNTAILCNNSTSKKPEKQHEVVVAVVETESPHHRPRAKKSSSSSSSSNPYEYYYYSGFGPSWGKKRGARRNNNAIPDRQDVKQCSSSQMHNEEFDYVEDEDDEEEETGKKRPRKPIKARSFKSLM